MTTSEVREKGVRVFEKIMQGEALTEAPSSRISFEISPPELADDSASR